MRTETKPEDRIAQLLEDRQYFGHPLREALAALFKEYRDNLSQIEKLTSISDGYQTVLHHRNHSLVERYRKQLRQLTKIMRISDQYQDVLQNTNEGLRIASMQDSLTELPNRRFMQDRLVDEAAAVARGRETFSLAMIDIDHFKVVNDDFGHDIGDKTLILVANKLSGTLRTYDICARWGGEEFLALLPETKIPAAGEVAERLRFSIQTLQDETAEGETLPAQMQLTISIGVAQHDSETQFSETLKRADSALYEAKKQGRNCIAFAS